MKWEDFDLRLKTWTKCIALQKATLLELPYMARVACDECCWDGSPLVRLLHDASFWLRCGDELVAMLLDKRHVGIQQASANADIKAHEVG